MFNPPHASHFGGAWERMIGVTRRILDSMLLRNGMKGLTHDTLSTFLAEVCAIVNSRPLTTITEDASDLSILTPAMILTQKVGHLPESYQPLNPKNCTSLSGVTFKLSQKNFGENGNVSIYPPSKFDKSGCQMIPV